jgi:hypothetical protein
MDEMVVPGISDQFLVFLMIVGAALAFTAVGIFSARRLDARIKREREMLQPRAEK